jgi:hypothetical protein
MSGRGKGGGKGLGVESADSSRQTGVVTGPPLVQQDLIQHPPPQHGPVVHLLITLGLVAPHRLPTDAPTEVPTATSLWGSYCNYYHCNSYMYSKVIILQLY